MKALLDENVSLDVRPVLETLGYTVIAVALLTERGMSDMNVFERAQNEKAILVTRDRDFTNSIRFPPHLITAILFIRDGNLKGSEEAEIIKRFLETHSSESFRGKLVSLSPSSTRIR